ncbi:MAG: FumA C-terminus/TtdB family hydratase beta subunit [Candidatus Cloacimonetes bacterium]|nr:FumA C-terminus/TtdB family hydratase beta subunit [Candidatus Cloacimonadota bacterium]
MNIQKLVLPLSLQDISQLKQGDKALLTGILLTARDAAHKRLAECISNKQELPFDLRESTIFYCGPSPTPDGKICGAVGPTTSSRMDKWTPLLLEHGLRAMIGKGERSEAVQNEIRRMGSIYFVAVGGISAYLTRHIVSCETYLWEELGTEAIYRLRVVDFPVYVSIV